MNRQEYPMLVEREAPKVKRLGGYDAHAAVPLDRARFFVHQVDPGVNLPKLFIAKQACTCA